MASTWLFSIAKPKVAMSRAHLSQEERYMIEALKSIGYNQARIAEELDRHPATIRRELKRNAGQRGYRHKQAHRQAQTRAQGSRNAKRISPATLKAV
ncbi:helix-turn-helix domain-containing protein [Hydromonas duriensis]|uniref:helix-turn-helix domain-containing protein n=1 Tax=Hydromonas duriensis TaxID=1527608 RepID=UPI0010609A3D